MYDTIIIGSGLGGLACGAILSRQGMSVCVLEQNTFDTGFHCVGGLRPGEVLHPFFRTLRLLDLPWVRMDEGGFEEIVFGDKSYFFAQGYERFVETLVSDFPRARSGLKAFVKMLKGVGDTLPRLFDADDTARRHTRELFSYSARDFLRETVKNPLLRRVIAGASLKMELHADTLPLYIFAQIHNSYIQSAWRLRGGGRSRPPGGPSAPAPASRASSPPTVASPLPCSPTANASRAASLSPTSIPPTPLLS